jgi:hypothetical protein
MGWYCPNCGQGNNDKRKECLRCNYTRFWSCKCGLSHLRSVPECHNCEDIFVELTEKKEHNSYLRDYYHAMNQRLETAVERLAEANHEVLIQQQIIETQNKEIETLKSQMSSDLVKRCKEAWTVEKQIIDLKKKLKDVSILLNDDHLCIICNENHKNMISLSCQHIFACDFCIGKIDRCPICRKEVATTMKVYYS